MDLRHQNYLPRICYSFNLLYTSQSSLISIFLSFNASSYQYLAIAQYCRSKSVNKTECCKTKLNTHYMNITIVQYNPLYTILSMRISAKRQLSWKGFNKLKAGEILQQSKHMPSRIQINIIKVFGSKSIPGGTEMYLTNDGAIPSAIFRYLYRHIRLTCWLSSSKWVGLSTGSLHPICLAQHKSVSYRMLFCTAQIDPRVVW